MNNNIYLSKTEYEIMKVLWAESESLTVTEIINASNGKILSTSIHPKLKNLMKIGFVEVDGKRTVVRVSARLYKAKISIAEYTSTQLHHILGKSERNLNLNILLSSLSNDFGNEDILRQAKQWIKDNQT